LPYEAYIGYLTDNSQEIRNEVKEREPFVLEVRDMDTFERLVVKAVVSDSADAIQGSDELWVLDWIENRMEAPWSIKLLEELTEEDIEAERSDVTDSDRTSAADEAKKYGGRKYRGAQLPDTMGGEEARKYYENVVAKQKIK
jgi:hypothetical protein